MSGKDNNIKIFDPWKIGLASVIAGAIGFCAEFMRELKTEKKITKQIVTGYDPEAFHIDSQSFDLVDRLQKHVRDRQTACFYRECLWLLDALLLREKRLRDGEILPRATDVPECHMMARKLEINLQQLTVYNTSNKGKNKDIRVNANTVSEARQLYTDFISFIKHHLQNIYTFCGNQ